MITNPDVKSLYRSCFNLHGNPPNALVLSAWRTAFAAVLFETDKSRITLAVSNAYAEIAERLNHQVEISGVEHKSIIAAQSELCRIATAAGEH
jgi:hypothetical protein